ncbi:MAG: hypothetical protein NT045_03050 [Candidatus Aureabacteria bacterium]|nr:hypothetical protein [Candidatus Auribacterota bacterium]
MYVPVNSYMMAAFFALAAAATGSRPCIAQSIPASPRAVEPVIVTGRGKAPPYRESKAKQRLMARRAAMLEAYKNVAKVVGRTEGDVRRGTGTERVEGFVVGARLIETRYYGNGDAEVDLELPGKAWAMFSAAPPPRDDARDDEPITVEKGGGTISETEWREILGRRAAARP